MHCSPLFFPGRVSVRKVWISLGLSHLGFIHSLKSVGLRLLPDLGNFQPFFDSPPGVLFSWGLVPRGYSILPKVPHVPETRIADFQPRPLCFSGRVIVVLASGRRFLSALFPLREAAHRALSSVVGTPSL